MAILTSLGNNSGMASSNSADKKIFTHCKSPTTPKKQNGWCPSRIVSKHGA